MIFDRIVVAFITKPRGRGHNIVPITAVLDYDINVGYWLQLNRLNFNNIVNRLFCTFTTACPLSPQAVYAYEVDQWQTNIID